MKTILNASVHQMNRATARALKNPKVAFSLSCMQCDAGDDVETHEQAIKEGWTNIHYDRDFALANFIGHCPVHREINAEPAGLFTEVA